MDFTDLGFLTQGAIRFKFGYLPKKKKLDLGEDRVVFDANTYGVVGGEAI